MRVTFAVVTMALAASPLAAQLSRPSSSPSSDASVRAALATITEADFRRRVGVLADDSMRGRATPSPELEKVAAWIGGEFQRFGLRPGGDNGTWFQRYAIRRSLLDSASTVMLMAGAVHRELGLGREASLLRTLGGATPEGAVNGPVVLLAGVPGDTARPFGDANLRGAIVVQVFRQAAGMNIQALILKGKEAGARGWVLLTAAPAQAFAQQVAGAFRPDLQMVQQSATPGLPVFLVRDSSAMDVLAAAGQNITTLRAGTTWVAQNLAMTGGFEVRRRVLDETSAPNVVGVLEGSDPQLKNEYVFFTGHMDHVGVAGGGEGCQARGADSICNGADDDASGSTGVIMLAQAFARMNPRPRRTLVFMTVSGEERGLWGSEYYSEHPLFPLGQTVADLNTDMIGRYFDNRPGWRDTIAVIGKEHSTLGATANRVSQEHPELHMQLVDDIWPNENFYFRSDHYNFARKGVPILFFFNGTHPDYHQVTDTVDKIDAEKAARIVQMVFHVGLSVANTTERPQWNPESRARIVENATP